MEKEYLNHLLEKRIKDIRNKDTIDQELMDCYGCCGCVVFIYHYNSTKFIKEYGTIEYMQKMQEMKIICNPVINKHHGEIIKADGERYIIYFKKVKKALDAMFDVLKYLSLYNEQREDLYKIQLCIGIGYGELIKVSNNDILGYEVNIAGRLGFILANAQEMLLSHAAMEQLKVESYEYAVGLKTEKIDASDLSDSEVFTIICQ